MPNKKNETDTSSKLIGILSEYESTIYNLQPESTKKILTDENDTELNESIKGISNVENIFNDVHCWIEDELIELDAINESINVFNNMFQESEKLKEKKQNLDIEIQSTQEGEGGIKALFTFKSKTEIIEDLKRDKQKTENDYNLLNKVIKIACYGLESTLKKYKDEIINNYYCIVKLYILITMKNGKIQQNVWSKIFDKLKVE